MTTKPAPLPAGPIGQAYKTQMLNSWRIDLEEHLLVAKERKRAEQELARRDAIIEALTKIIETAMSANMKKTVKIETDETTGKVRVKRVRKFDASKARRIAKSKTQRVVSPAKARAAR